MAPPPNLEAFNAPSREVCTVRRERTNTPLQALVTLNDPQFVEAARVLAQQALSDAKRDDVQLFDYIGRHLLCRELSNEELAILQSNMRTLLDFYQAHPADAKQLIAVGDAPVDDRLDVTKLAAWTMVCNQMMNLDEVLNK